MTSVYLANVAAAALGSGLSITSPSPGVSGTYPVDEQAQQAMMKVVSYVAVNGKFPAGLTSWPLLDVTGIVHQIPSIAVFNAVMTAIADYAAQLTLLIDGRSAATSVPPPFVTITI